MNGNVQINDGLAKPALCEADKRVRFLQNSAAAESKLACLKDGEQPSNPLAKFQHAEQTEFFVVCHLKFYTKTRQKKTPKQFCEYQ